MTASATPAFAAREDTVPSASAPELLPVLVLLAATAGPDDVSLAAPDDEANAGVLPASEPDEEAGVVMTEDAALPETDAVEVVFDDVELVPITGAGTAADGSARAPVPQGIA